MFWFNSCAVVLAIRSSLVTAQFPPKPEGVTRLKSKFHDKISISYKEPGICETTEGVKSYAGYVHLPPNALDEPHEDQDYPLNTFFWFFEARKDPANAPLAIWLNGGPGGSSMMGALAENGPCFVGNDSNSTYLNPWSWNNEVNMLYIDQPNQVGYSYGTLANITATLRPDEGDWHVQLADFSDGVPEQNQTFLVGTTASQIANNTANTTAHAAVAIWHFAQTWFEEFPHYKPNDEQISLFTESYGGHYGPEFMRFFMRQNELIANGTISGPGAHYMHMNTLGIINGCINTVDQAWAGVYFANNNTYGIKAFSDEEYYHGLYELSRKNGGIDQLHECERMAAELDPSNYGDVEKVNEFCRHSLASVKAVTVEAYMAKRKNGVQDITHRAEDPFPPAYLTSYLNQHWVQKALGVPVNHSAASAAVAVAFTSTGDKGRASLVDDMAYILDHGVKIAMLYGDRDYICNWINGERTSLRVPWASRGRFHSAGYTPLVISPVHSAGLTRQYGNFSFTRVYQAGHLVPSYQPEAAYEIFMRALTGRDIATGTVDLQAYAAAEGEQYVTRGPSDTWWMRSDLLPPPAPECYVRSPITCTREQIDSLFDGTAIVKDWILVGKKEGHSTTWASEQDQVPLGRRDQ